MAVAAQKGGDIVILPGPPRRSWPRRHLILIGALAAALVASVGIAIDVSRRASLKPPPVVLVAPATRGRVVGNVVANGALAPAQITLVAQAIPGRLTQVLVKPGEPVRKGQILARFDPLALRADLARAEARLVGAELAALEAEVALLRRGIHPSQRDLLEESDGPDLEGPDAIALARAAKAAADVTASEVAHHLANQRLADGIVRAPIAGLVLERKASEGELLAPGAPLFFIAAEPMVLQLEATIPEAATARIEVGQAVEFTVPAFAGRRFGGRVQRVLPFTGPESARKLPVIISVNPGSQGLRAGMTAAVSIHTTSDRAVVRVPSAALLFSPRGTTHDHGEPTVWLKHDSSAELRRVSVEVGVMDGTFAEVRGDGLHEGAGVAVGYASTK